MLLVTRRFFCKVLCPLGAIWSLMNRTSLVRLEVDGSRCTSCGACAAACPTQVDVPADINSPECLRCLDCVRACPSGAIAFMGRKEGAIT